MKLLMTRGGVKLNSITPNLALFPHAASLHLYTAGLRPGAVGQSHYPLSGCGACGSSVYSLSKDGGLLV